MKAAQHRPAPIWSGRNDVEDGAEARRVHHCLSNAAARAVTGFACDLGVRRNQGRPGAAEGPTALRHALANLAAPPSLAFSDLGDIVPEHDDLDGAQMAMASHVCAALRAHNRIVVFGGGHETALASFSGLRAAFPDQKIGILNLDAHLDLRAVGAMGATSGTPFAQIRALEATGFDYLCVGVARESNTQALFNRAHDWRVGIVEDHALRANPHAAHPLIDALMARSDVLYLTICLDVLPHFQAPGVSAPAARGVAFTTIEMIVAHVLKAEAKGVTRLPVCDIVELSPPHDPTGMTARTAAFLARRLLAD